MASEEMVFENVDDGRTTTMDACLYYKLTYEPSAQVTADYKLQWDPTQKLHIQELWFLHYACHLLLLNICMK